MNWKVKPKAPSAFLKKFSNFSPLIVQLLYNRSLLTEKEAEEFFDPDFKSHVYDPFLLKDMDKAVKRILKAIEKKESIAIFGDFDADGVCSSAIIFFALKSLGVEKIDIYIPDRDKENHGFNKEAIAYLAGLGTRVIISVDCGSSEKDAQCLKEAEGLGLDFIITDHHETGRFVPKAEALVNPLQKGDLYPFKDLAGAGVAYKLARALFKKKGDPENLSKWLLDLTALATVADMQSIIGENRTLVRYGLGVMAQTKWIGLQKLMEVAGVSPQVIKRSLDGEAPRTNLDTATLGFVLGPRLNAAGRMDHANVSFELLTSFDRQEAERLAKQIDRNNTDRQSLTVKLYQEIEDKIAGYQEMPSLIFEGSPYWPKGLLGLAAGKIMEKYRRPAVIYHENERLIHASCRSIAEFDLMETLNQCADYFEDFGGRFQTGGFKSTKENLEKIKEAFEEAAQKQLAGKDLTPCLEIETELSLADLNFQNYYKIANFAPFGRANPKPLFLSKNLEVLDLRKVGNNGGHLKMELAMFDDDFKVAQNVKTIGFGMGEWTEKIKKGDLIDVVFEMIVNEWNNNRSLEMKIVDLKHIHKH